MCTESDNQNNPSQMDYYEKQASQEEIYLEEIEEELRLVLESDESSSRECENLDIQRAFAVEELIVGDADDPPLSEIVIGELIRRSSSKS